jgi:small subunit ribosomal protein S14
MTKASKIAKNEQRRRTVARYAERRAELNDIVRRPSSTPEERAAAVSALQRLPRDSSPVRVRNRDAVDGRPRGHLRKFGLSRVRVRELGHRGESSPASPRPAGNGRSDRTLLSDGVKWCRGQLRAPDRQPVCGDEHRNQSADDHTENEKRYRLYKHPGEPCLPSLDPGCRLRTTSACPTTGHQDLHRAHPNARSRRCGHGVILPAKGRIPACLGCAFAGRGELDWS